MNLTKCIATTPYEQLTGADKAVADALGEFYLPLKKLAAMLFEQPATQKYVESEMGRIIARMTPAQLLGIRSACTAAGVRPGDGAKVLAARKRSM